MGDARNDKRQDIHNSEIPVLCRSCESRHKGICGALTSGQLVELSKHTVKSVYEAGSEIFPAGEKSARNANILSGVVKQSKLTSDGRQQIVSLQFAPDFLGRPFGRHNDVAVEAATDVRVCSFPASLTDALIGETPELEHRLHKQTLKDLDQAREWMLTLGRKTAVEKVASFLYLIATHIDPEMEATDKTVKFDIPLKRADIADFLGLTIETVSRQITKLRQTGVINIIHNRTVEVPDIARLRRLTEQDNG